MERYVLLYLTQVFGDKGVGEMLYPSNHPGGLLWTCSDSSCVVGENKPPLQGCKRSNSLRPSLQDIRTEVFQPKLSCEAKKVYQSFPVIADADAFKILLEMKLKKRQKKPALPSTVTELDTEDGSKVYVVGTAHFSDSSKKDVVKTIQEVQPDVVVVELCQYRVSMLKMDEKTLLKEAKEINLEKLQQAIKQNGVMSGLMQMLLLKVSAHITEQLGMAPGGEFREAFKEASKVPFCKFHLGDRPIPVTFKRAIAALSFWQKVKLGWGLCFLSDPISKDDVEKCKQKDLLEQMMAEMIGEFPDLHRTIVSERDIYLTYMLKQAAKQIELPRASENEPRRYIPAVVVGVVGMGHVPGIEKNWNSDLKIQEIMSVPPPSTSSKIFKFVLKATVFGLLGYGCYRIGHRTVQFVLSMPAAQSYLQRLTEVPQH
ncbi:TraB domain-containing protein [Pitangus sulphuratus]|nr:TraB domain-containing protein [Pitangus sulphuratus]